MTKRMTLEKIGKIVQKKRGKSQGKTWSNAAKKKDFVKGKEVKRKGGGWQSQNPARLRACSGEKRVGESRLRAVKLP